MSRLERLITEIHRRSLWQVLGIYAMASWAIYEVVLGLYEGIGLPDFLPRTTLALLLVFLPVVLATAFVQEGGPRRGRTDDTMTEGPEGPSRLADAGTPKPKTGLFTWNRAITLGVLAFALLGLATTGVMGMRALGIGPAATLISSGVLEDKEPILLADLAAPSGDSLLAAALTEALRVDLEQSPAVRLVPGPSVQEALRRMQRDPSSHLTPALAREVALREGVRALVVGEVLPAGNRYVVAARVTTPDGDVLASDRQSADDDGLIEAVDRLSSNLRSRIGESLQSLHATQPLARVTTGSLDALRKYTQGLRAFENEADTRKAIRLLREAVALDSTFTMAWRKLGAAYQNRGDRAGRDSMRVAFTHAFRHRDRSTDRERYLTEGGYYQMVANEPQKAIVALEMVLDLGSEDAIALGNLALLYNASGNWDRAAELQSRALAVGRGSGTAWRNYVAYLVHLRRFEDATAALDDYERAHPDHYQVPLRRGYLAAVRFDYATAEAEFEKVRGFTGHEHGADAALWAVAGTSPGPGRRPTVAPGRFGRRSDRTPPARFGLGPRRRRRSGCRFHRAGRCVPGSVGDRRPGRLRPTDRLRRLGAQRACSRQG
ncbi:MAG: tetratricopeptide repeat protein [Gemmatimonadota bacterium]